MSNWHNKET